MVKQNKHKLKASIAYKKKHGIPLAKHTQPETTPEIEEELEEGQQAQEDIQQAQEEIDNETTNQLLDDLNTYNNSTAIDSQASHFQFSQEKAWEKTIDFKKADDLLSIDLKALAKKVSLLPFQIRTGLYHEPAPLLSFDNEPDSVVETEATEEYYYPPNLYKKSSIHATSPSSTNSIIPAAIPDIDMQSPDKKIELDPVDEILGAEPSPIAFKSVANEEKKIQTVDELESWLDEIL